MIPFLRKGHGGVLLIIIGGLLLRLTVLALKYNSLELDASFVVQGELARNILNGRGLVVNQQHISTILQTWRSTSTLVDLEDIPPPSSEYLEPEYFNEPGYGLLLAGLWKIFGQRWISIRLLQILIDTGMIFLMFTMGMCVWNRTTGLFAAGLYAVLIPQIELAVRPHRDAWVTFAFIVSTFFLLQLTLSRQKRKEVLIAVGIAFVVALTAWLRSTILVYVVVLALTMFFLKSFRRATMLSAIVITVFVALLSPLLVRNCTAFGKFMVTRGAVWHSFWAGVGQFRNPYGMKESDEFIVKYFQQRYPSAHYGTPEYEDVLKDKALKLLSEHPWWYASTVFRRAAVIISPKIGRETFFEDSSRPTNTGILNVGLSRWILLLIDGLMVATLLTGFWLCRKKWRLALLVALPLVYTLLTLSPFYVVGRNIMNIYFVTLIFAAVSFDFLIQKVETRFRVAQSEEV